MNPTLGLSALRTALLSGEPDRHPEIIDTGSGLVEVRDPNYSDIEAMNRLYKDKPMHGTLSMVVACTYVPGTNTRVFTDNDIRDLLGRPVGGWLAKLMDAVGAKIKAATDLGNSPSPTLPSASST